MIFWLNAFCMPSISHSTGFNKKIQLCWKFCIDGWETCHVWDSCWCSYVCTVMGLSVSISTIEVRCDIVRHELCEMVWIQPWAHHNFLLCCFLTLSYVSAEMFPVLLLFPAIAPKNSYFLLLFLGLYIAELDMFGDCVPIAFQFWVFFLNVNLCEKNFLFVPTTW